MGGGGVGGVNAARMMGMSYRMVVVINTSVDVNIIVVAAEMVVAATVVVVVVDGIVTIIMHVIENA